MYFKLLPRHCEAQSAEAIQSFWIASSEPLAPPRDDTAGGYERDLINR